MQNKRALEKSKKEDVDLSSRPHTSKLIHLISVLYSTK